MRRIADAGADGRAAIPEGMFCHAMDEPSSALSFLDTREYAAYDSWFAIMCAFHDAGGTFEAFDEWSRCDAAHYGGTEETRKHWDSISDAGSPGGGKITKATLYKAAYEAADWRWSADQREFGRQRRMAKPAADPNMNPACLQAVAFLEANFLSGEYVCIVTESRRRDDGSGKHMPVGYGRHYGRDELIAALRNAADITDAIGVYDEDAGVWVVQNPTDGKGKDAAHITAYRNALVECDEQSLEEQLELAGRAQVPATTRVFSGGRSYHLNVRVDAEGPGQYADRVQDLYGRCRDFGLEPDAACANPNRLTRLPGCRRGGKDQTLDAVRLAPESFRHWLQRTRPRATESAAKASLPPIRAVDLDTPVSLEPEIIPGLLRRGCKGLIVAASKAGKTWLVMELACAVASGGRWLGFDCVRGRVLYVNFELQAENARSRLMKVADECFYDGALIRQNLDIWNLRGYSAPLDELKADIIANVQGGEYDLIIFDPFYKLLNGDENSAEVIGRFCRDLEEVARDCGGAVVYTHHHSKGMQNLKAAQDRASGSGVFARDADALIDLTELYVPEELRDSSGIGDLPCFRASFVVRDFPRIADKNVIFKVPRHLPEVDGILASCKIDSPQAQGAKMTAEKNREKSAGKVLELQRSLVELLERNGNVALPYMRTAREITGASDSTLRRYQDQLDSGVLTIEATDYGPNMVRLVEGWSSAPNEAPDQGASHVQMPLYKDGE